MFVCVACVLSSACFIYPRWLCVCISSAPMPVASQTADASLKQAISLRRNGHVRGGGGDPVPTTCAPELFRLSSSTLNWTQTGVSQLRSSLAGWPRKDHLRWGWSPVVGKGGSNSIARHHPDSLGLPAQRCLGAFESDSLSPQRSENRSPRTHFPVLIQRDRPKKMSSISKTSRPRWPRRGATLSPSRGVPPTDCASLGSRSVPDPPPRVPPLPTV